MERLCCRRATRISSAPKQVCITVSLPNGHFEAILCDRNWFVSDLERLAEKVFQKGFLRLAGLDGQVLDSKLSLNMAGLEDRDILTAIAQAPKVAATALSFALWHCNSHMVVWGRPQVGGDCSRVQNRLECVQEVQASFCSFAAIRDSCQATSSRSSRAPCVVAKAWQKNQACLYRPSVALLCILLWFCTCSCAQATEIQSDIDVTGGFPQLLSLNYNATAQMSSDAMNSDCGFSYFSVFHILALCAFHMMRGICMLAMPTIHAWSAKLAMSLVYVILRLLSQSEPVACVRQAHEGNYLHKQTGPT